MLDFINLPSRFSYYDTETKLVGRYKRYQFVVDFFKKLGFKPSESNFGPEFEQSFIFEMYEGFFGNQILFPTFAIPNGETNGFVAQLNRTSDYGSEGFRFES